MSEYSQDNQYTNQPDSVVTPDVHTGDQKITDPAPEQADYTVTPDAAPGDPDPMQEMPDEDTTMTAATTVAEALVQSQDAAMNTAVNTLDSVNELSDPSTKILFDGSTLKRHILTDDYKSFVAYQAEFQDFFKKQSVKNQMRLLGVKTYIDKERKLKGLLDPKSLSEHDIRELNGTFRFKVKHNPLSDKEIAEMATHVLEVNILAGRIDTPKSEEVRSDMIKEITENLDRMNKAGLDIMLRNAQSQYATEKRRLKVARQMISEDAKMSRIIIDPHGIQDSPHAAPEQPLNPDKPQGISTVADEGAKPGQNQGNDEGLNPEKNQVADEGLDPRENPVTAKGVSPEQNSGQNTDTDEGLNTGENTVTAEGLSSANPEKIHSGQSSETAEGSDPSKTPEKPDGIRPVAAGGDSLVALEKERRAIEEERQRLKAEREALEKEKAEKQKAEEATALASQEVDTKQKTVIEKPIYNSATDQIVGKTIEYATIFKAYEAMGKIAADLQQHPFGKRSTISNLKQAVERQGFALKGVYMQVDGADRKFRADIKGMEGLSIDGKRGMSSQELIQALKEKMDTLAPYIKEGPAQVVSVGKPSVVKDEKIAIQKKRSMGM